VSFIVYSLPRSRSYWLSRFLTYGNWYCGHDEVRHLRSLDDVASWCKLPNTGTVETGAMSFWRLVPDHWKAVTVRRPVDEVVASMRQFGLSLDWDVFAKFMRRLDRKLDQIERRVPNVLRVTFEELRTEAACQAVFEHCLPFRHDARWWRSIALVNMQCHLSHVMNYMHAYAPQLDKLAKVAKHRMLARIRPDPVEHDDGLTIQQEPWSIAYRDAERLADEHCIIIGQTPDYHRLMNHELLEKLDSRGMLQVTTGRANGRLFGYLVTIIAPSLESADLTIATNTAFMCSREFRGLGLKLQRASVDALKRRGIDKVYLHAGIRGEGRRIGSLYRRMGAESVGDWYKLELSG
jgi:GNAT superfamily N-acetyltransferase